MKICPNCGKELADDVKFCEKCGFSLDTASQNQTGDQNAAPQDANGAQIQQGFNQNGSFNQFSSQYVEFDPKDHTTEYDARDIADNKLFAVLAYIGLMGMIVALLVNNSPFARFHAKNGAMLEVATIISLAIMIIPFVGWVVSPIVNVILLIIRVIGFINTLKGKAKELPIVSDIGFLG